MRTSTPRAAASRAEAEAKRPASLFAQWEQVLWQLDRVLRSVQGEPGFGVRVDELVQRLRGIAILDVIQLPMQEA